jgi:hypothetical protein
MFCRHIILRLLHCIAENIQVTEGVNNFFKGCMLVSPVLSKGNFQFIIHDRPSHSTLCS